MLNKITKHFGFSGKSKKSSDLYQEAPLEDIRVKI